jgi:hypothetical protein
MFYPARFLVIALFGLLVACSTSGNQETATAEAESTQVAAVDDAGAEGGGENMPEAFDPIRCKKFSPTGTRVPVKVCKKQSEWDQIREGSQNAGQDIQRRAVHSNQTL